MRQSHGNWHGYGDASHRGTGRLLLRHSAATQQNLWRKTAALVMNIDDMSKRLKAVIERKVNQQD